jgi:hypothetical protein
MSACLSVWIFLKSDSKIFMLFIPYIFL